MEQVSSFGRRLRRLRLAKGLSQKELAEQAGVARSLVANVERGIRGNTSLLNATKLADVLGVSLDLLARGGFPELEDDPAPTRPRRRR